jgi:hypothetical protein
MMEARGVAGMCLATLLIISPISTVVSISSLHATITLEIYLASLTQIVQVHSIPSVKSVTLGSELRWLKTAASTQYHSESSHIPLSTEYMNARTDKLKF